MRTGSPPILHACPFIGFSSSKSPLELMARRIVNEIEGNDTTNLDKYATTGSEHYCRMVESIRQKMNFTSLKYTAIEDLVTSIGLPKERICTHCYDGSSQF
jgi:amidophosphoribosyltransferase